MKTMKMTALLIALALLSITASVLAQTKKVDLSAPQLKKLSMQRANADTRAQTQPRGSGQEYDANRVARDPLISGGTFSYVTSDTSNATQNSPVFDFGVIPPGTTVRFGTCLGPSYDDLALASGSGDTFLRLYFQGNEISAVDDTVGCGLTQYGTFTTPYSGQVQVQAGCYSSTYCSGVIQFKFDLPDGNGSLTDVAAKFRDIVGTSPKRYKLNVRQAGLIPADYKKSWKPWDVSPHFQGVQRITSSGGYLALTGSSDADLFIAQISPVDTGGLIGPQPDTPNTYTEVIAHTTAPRFQNSGHLGGIQATGHWLVGGVENSNSGQASLSFWDTVDVRAPRLVREHTITDGEASAIAITKMWGFNSKFVMAVGGRGAAVRMFVVENSDVGPRLEIDAVSDRGLLNLGASWPAGPGGEGFQSLNFVAQDNGELFLIGMWGQGETHPEQGTDKAVLYRVNHSNFANFTLTKIAEKVFVCQFEGRRQCAFNATGGVFVDADADRLVVYSSKAWRPDDDNSPITFVEFF